MADLKECSAAAGNGWGSGIPTTVLGGGGEQSLSYLLLLVVCWSK